MMSPQLKILLSSGKTNFKRLEFCMFLGILLFSCIYYANLNGSSNLAYIAIVIFVIIGINIYNEYKNIIQNISIYINQNLTDHDKHLLIEELKYNQPSLSINFIGLVISGVSVIISCLFSFTSLELTLFLQDYSKAESKNKLFKFQQILYDEIIKPLQDNLIKIIAVAFLFALIFSFVYLIRIFRFYKYKTILGLLYHSLY